MLYVAAVPFVSCVPSFDSRQGWSWCEVRRNRRRSHDERGGGDASSGGVGAGVGGSGEEREEGEAMNLVCLELHALGPRSVCITTEGVVGSGLDGVFPHHHVALCRHRNQLQRGAHRQRPAMGAATGSARDLSGS